MAGENYFDMRRQLEKLEFTIKEKGADKTAERNIEIRQQPLFGLYSTLISVERALKPVVVQPQYYSGDIVKLLELARESPDVLKGNLEDFIKQNSARIIKSRNKVDSGDCPFCPQNIEERTPKPRKIHSHLKTLRDDRFELASPPESAVISVPNLYPFSKPHYLTIFSTHKPDINLLTLDDMFNYLESAYEIAEEIAGMRAEGIDGMWDIINWGPEAAASQQHPHAQRGGIAEKMITEMDNEYKACYDARNVLCTDPFEDYMKQIRESPFFGFENEQVFIHAPSAPKFPHQIDIICKPRGGRKIGNILDLKDKKDREVIAHSMLGVFHLLYDKCQVTDLNMVMHQSRFSARNKACYYLHWHILPRNLNKLGGFEVYLGSYVVSVFPERTAEMIREHYK